VTSDGSELPIQHEDISAELVEFNDWLGKACQVISALALVVIAVALIVIAA
jgi:hypothetical protein